MHTWHPLYPSYHHKLFPIVHCSTHPRDLQIGYHHLLDELELPQHSPWLAAKRHGTNTSLILYIFVLYLYYVQALNKLYINYAVNY